jgi:hypothetical protein
MKFGQLFKREKTQPKSEETHPPEETIACPYCGHRYWTKSMAISGILARNHTFREWLARFRCVGGMQTAGCGREFWIVGSYGEIKHTKPFSI